jgi:hypothetical protein
MILISEVASLGRDFERVGQHEYSRSNIKATFPKWDCDAGNSDEVTSAGPHHVRDRSLTLSREKEIDKGRRDKLTGSLSQSQRIKMMQLLDYWDEPETVRKRHVSQESRCFQLVLYVQGTFTHSYFVCFWHRVWRRSTMSS